MSRRGVKRGEGQRRPAPHTNLPRPERGLPAAAFAMPFAPPRTIADVVATAYMSREGQTLVARLEEDR